MDYSYLVDAVLIIGSEMLRCGGEISRVEDTINRILKAYNVKGDIFVITSAIIITAHAKGRTYTQAKRIYYTHPDLNRLHLLNSLSRRICSCPLSPAETDKYIKKILSSPCYTLKTRIIIYSLTALSVTLYLGGSIKDSIISSLIAPVLIYLTAKGESTGINPFLVTLFSSFVTGAIAVCTVNSGIGSSIDNIITGNIMLIIPGAAITNSLRDVIEGDTISGLLRFSEALIKAFALTLGFVSAAVYTGGF